MIKRLSQPHSVLVGGMALSRLQIGVTLSQGVQLRVKQRRSELHQLAGELCKDRWLTRAVAVAEGEAGDKIQDFVSCGVSSVFEASLVLLLGTDLL